MRSSVGDSVELAATVDIVVFVDATCTSPVPAVETKAKSEAGFAMKTTPIKLRKLASCCCLVKDWFGSRYEQT